MSNTILTIIVAIIAAGPGIIALLIQIMKLVEEKRVLKTTADKTEAETAGEIGEAWKELLEPYRQEIDRLKQADKYKTAKINELEDRVRLFEEILSGAHRLYNQLQSHEIDPVWIPPNRREIYNPKKEGG